MRTFIVGDIHGCYAELKELLNTAGVTENDSIVAVGDFLDRGPDSPAVLDLFRTRPLARSVMGNHERKHVRSFRGEIRPALSQQLTKRQFGDGYSDVIAFLDALPRWIELPECLVVHGYYEPGVAIEQQREEILVGTMTGERLVRERCTQPWYELYDGEKPLVVGHYNYRSDSLPFVFNDRVYCLDTGCCQGGRLTGLWIPEFKLVSVPAHQPWWSMAKAQARPREDLSWEEAERRIALAQVRESLSKEEAERLERFRDWLARANQAVAALLSYLQSEHQRVLSALREQGHSFEELSEVKQGRLYAQQLGKHPFAPFLHKARHGRLDSALVRDRLRTPAAALQKAIELGLLSPAPVDEENDDE